MAIVFDNANSASAFVADVTVPLNVAAGDNRYLFGGVGVRRDIAQGAPSINSVTYAGDAMALKDSFNLQNASGLFVWLYGLVGPTSGLNNMIIDGNWAAGQNIVGIAVSYTGVATAVPIGAPVQHIDATADGESINVVSQAGEVVVDIYSIIGIDSAAIAQGGGQTLRQKLSAGVGGAQVAVGMSDEPGAPTVTMSWSGVSAGNPEGIIGVALKPFVGLRGRAVSYYYDLWDPKPSIKDVQGKVVPPDQLRADAWVEMQGAKLPQSEVYNTFVQDPTKARVVEVNSSRGAATLKASRSQFADVLIKRAAAGRG